MLRGGIFFLANCKEIGMRKRDLNSFLDISMMKDSTYIQT